MQAGAGTGAGRKGNGLAPRPLLKSNHEIVLEDGYNQYKFTTTDSDDTLAISDTNQDY